MAGGGGLRLWGQSSCCGFQLSGLAVSQLELALHPLFQI